MSYSPELIHALNTPMGNTQLPDTLYNLGLEELPQEGVLLNIGSSDAAIFERQAAIRYPNLKIFSVDPNLVDSEYRADFPHGKAYELPLSAHEFSAQVIALPALAQHLPFRDGAFDIVISHAAIPIYLPNHEAYGDALSNIHRVLKPSGYAYLAPMDSETARYTDETCQQLGIRTEIQYFDAPHYAQQRSMPTWARVIISGSEV